ncbi:hypothetical protein Tco_0411669 [Tanacetum coccineum]
MMEESPYNQFRGDKFLLLRVLQGPSLKDKVGVTLGNKGLLLVTTTKGNDICPNNALNQGGKGMIHGSRIKCCWFKLKQEDKFYMRRNSHFWQIQEFQKLKPHRLSLLTMLLINLMIWMHVLAEVHNPDTTDMMNQGVQYLHESQQAAIQNSNSSAQQDALILSVIEQLRTQVTHCTQLNLENKSVNGTLTVELERYKEQVKVLKAGQNVELTSNDKFLDSHDQNAEIDRLKQIISKQLREKESLMKTVTVLKDDFKKKESRNLDREIALEKKIKHLDNIVYKRGYQNPFYLKKAQQLEPKLYDGDVILNNYTIEIPNFEETLMLAEESRSKMLLKQQDPMVLEKKVNTKPVYYVALNKLSQDFEKRFVPQTELSVEQAF